MPERDDKQSLRPLSLLAVLLLVLGIAGLYYVRARADSSKSPQGPQSPQPQPRPTRALPENLDRRDVQGRTPLMVACRDGESEMAQRLVAAGADVNARSSKGFTPLMYAASHQQSGLVKLLLEHDAEPDVRAQGGFSAIFYAAMTLQPESVRLLIAAGADVNVATDTGYTSLMSAAREGHQEIVQMLLAAGADVNAVGKEMLDTPLHWAAENGHAEIVRLLVEKGADTEAKRGDGVRAIDLARAMGHDEVARVLLAAGTRRPQPVTPDYRGHLQQGVLVVAFSPDGSQLISGSVDGSICFWSLDGTPRRYLRASQYWVDSIVLSADGSELLTATHTSLKLLDVAAGRVKLATTEYVGSVYAGVYAPDGRSLVSGSAGNNVLVWDRQSGAKVAELAGHQKAVKALVFASGGGGSTLLASAGEDGTVRLWDWSRDDARPLRTLEGHAKGVDNLAVSPDGRWLVSGGRDGTTRLWALPSGKLQRVYNRCTGAVSSLAISPDGGTVAVACSQGLLTMRELTTGRQVAKVLPVERLVSVAYSPDGCLLVAGCQGGISLVDTADHTLRKVVTTDSL